MSQDDQAKLSFREFVEKYFPTVPTHLNGFLEAWYRGDRLDPRLSLSQRIQSIRLAAERESRPWANLAARVVMTRSRPSYLVTDREIKQISNGLDAADQKIVDQCQAMIEKINRNAVRQILGLFPDSATNAQLMGTRE